LAQQRYLYFSQFAIMRNLFLQWVLPMILLTVTGCGEESKKTPAPMGGGEKNKPLKVDLFIVQPAPFAETIGRDPSRSGRTYRTTSH
jgi:predicted small lipoprotein YifL